MPSMRRAVFAFFRVQRLKRHADLQPAVARIGVRRAVGGRHQSGLGSVARQLAQRLRNRQLDLCLVHIGQQKVTNWLQRGIPAHVKVAHPELFMPELAERFGCQFPGTPAAAGKAAAE